MPQRSIERPAERLAEWAAGLDLAAIPAPVVHAATLVRGP